jgi:hypothetical protein
VEKEQKCSFSCINNTAPNLRAVMVNPKRFYTYAYLREDRTPYYIGKGKENREYRKHKGEIRPPKDKSRIILLKQNLTEEEAFNHEKYMIAVFGRKDLGTGILHNRTNGGEGISGAIVSEETRKKQSEMNMGEKNPNYGKRWNEEQRKKLAEYRSQFVGEKNNMYGKERKDLSERNKKPKYWVTNGEIDKLILREDYEYYVSIGFQKGRCNVSEKFKPKKGKKFSEKHKKNLMGSSNAKSFYWKITFSDGREIIQCGLTNWAKENGYDSIAIRKIASGKAKTHKDIVLVEKINP